MMEKRNHLEMAFTLPTSSSQKVPTGLLTWINEAPVIHDTLYSLFQVIEYTKLSIQNLQLAVNHCRKEAAAQVC